VNLFKSPFRKGQKVKGFVRGKWEVGTYIRQGENPGEHFIKVKGKDEKIVYDEIQFMVGEDNK